MENVAVTQQDRVVQLEHPIPQGCSSSSRSQPPLRPPSEDYPSRATPPPLGTSSSRAEAWDLESQEGASTPPPPPAISSCSSSARSRNSHPGQAKLLSQNSLSSVRNRSSPLKPLETTPPGPSPSSSFDASQFKERQVSGTPSPEQSLHGSLTVDRQERQDETASPYAHTSPILSNGQGEATPPPEDDGLKYSDDLERGEKRGVGSPTNLEAVDSAFEEILRLPITDRVRVVASSNLIYKRKDADGALAINFATLQRMRLQKLQSEIAKHALDMRYQARSDFDWEEPLQAYIQAWRDLDYMQDCAKRKNDPFLVISSRCLDAAVIREHLADIRLRLNDQDQDLIELYRKDSSFPDPKDTNKPEVLGGYRSIINQETKFKGFLVRLGMATLAWLFIVGPMLLMVLNNTKLTALVTTSVCVGAFGVMMARALEKPFDVLSATAAYAAVLVVFVGTSTTAGYGN